MLIEINGHQLNVQDEGEPGNPPVLLLHHGLGSVRAWRGQIAPLVEAGFRVLAYDRWGYGGSDARPALDLPYFTTDLDDLHTLLDRLGIQQTAMVGHSDGGSIGLYYAARQPQRVSCIVTVAAHIYVEAKMEPGILGIRQAFETDARFRNGMQHAHGDKSEAVFNNWFNGWQRQEAHHWDMRLELRRITCPVLVVQGEQDEHATPQHAMDIAASIPGAEVWIVPGGRHMLPQEQRLEFNQKIFPFLMAHAMVSHDEIG